MKMLTSKGRLGELRGIPKLRILRQQQGLSLGQLSDLTGLRRNTITHLESGREIPEPSHLRILARVLGVATFDLIS